MNILGIFKKVEHVAEVGATIALPFVTVINPGVGALLGNILHGILNAQAMLPENTPDNNAAKRAFVTQIAVATAATVGLQLAPTQTTALIEGILKGLQDAANAVPTEKTPAPAIPIK